VGKAAVNASIATSSVEHSGLAAANTEFITSPAKFVSIHEADNTSQVTAMPTWVEEARGSNMAAVYIVLSAALTTIAMVVSAVVAIIRIFS
jgi:hypothetical protein